MAKTVLSCVNLKGGVGKTALAVNLAAIAASKHDLKTLLIDLDPQTNATFWCLGPEGWEKWASKNGTLANLFGVRSHTSAQNKKKSFSKVVCEEVFPGVDLLPSHLDLFTMDLDLAGTPMREHLLKRALKDNMDDYELIICDCPPNLTLPTQNALSISTHYVVPVSLDYLSSLGISLLLNRVEELSEDLEVGGLDCAGIVVSRVGRPSFHRQETKATLQSEFPNHVLDETIGERDVVSRAAQKKKPVHVIEPSGKAAKEFQAVADVVLERCGAI
jgi:chromosome partitioning protein